MRLRASVINIPTKVGPLSWEQCLEEALERGSLVGVNESTQGKMSLWLRLAKEHGYGVYAYSTPNPLFWDKEVYRLVAHNVHKIHDGEGGRWEEKYPGYNAERYITEAVFTEAPESDASTPNLAVLHTHWVPNGRKVNGRWRTRMRRESKRLLRTLIKKHLAAGRIVIVMGDFNIRLPFYIMGGFVWVRATGVDKIGVICPKGWKIKAKKWSRFRAPTDHKYGAAATVSFEKIQASHRND